MAKSPVESTFDLTQKIKKLAGYTPQGYSGELLKESQFVWRYNVTLVNVSFRWPCLYVRRRTTATNRIRFLQ